MTSIEFDLCGKVCIFHILGSRDQISANITATYIDIILTKCFTFLWVSFIGDCSHPSHIYEDKYLAMRRNKDEILTHPNQSKENFVLFAEEEINQVETFYFYEVLAYRI